MESAERFDWSGLAHSLVLNCWSTAKALRVSRFTSWTMNQPIVFMIITVIYVFGLLGQREGLELFNLTILLIM